MLSWYTAGHVCWDDQDIINNQPTGVIRVSFGYASTKEDAESIIRFITETFQQTNRKIFNVTRKPIEKQEQQHHGPATRHDASIPPYASTVPIYPCGPCTHAMTTTVHSIFIYPVKSCAGIQIDAALSSSLHACRRHDHSPISSYRPAPVPRPQPPVQWPIDLSGTLLFDRQWLILDCNGRQVTLRKHPQMVHIQPRIDIQSGVLILEYNTNHSARDVTYTTGVEKGGCFLSPLYVPLLCSPHGSFTVASRPIKISTGQEIADWLECVLGIPCCSIIHQAKDNNNEVVVVEEEDDDNRKGDMYSGNENRKNEQTCMHTTKKSSFANTAQLLVVRLSEVQELKKKARMMHESDEIFLSRFRPNIVLQDVQCNCSHGVGDDGFDIVQQCTGSRNSNSQEEHRPWKTVMFTMITTTTTPSSNNNSNNNEINMRESSIDVSQSAASHVEYEVQGLCPRCDIICINPRTAQRNNSEPLMTIAKHAKQSKVKKRLSFGLLLNKKESSSMDCTAMNMHVGLVAILQHD